MKAQGLNLQSEKREEASQKLSGKTFVLTGSLPSFTRKEATEIIEKHGGKVTSSVSSNTDYLLAGDSPGSKYDKAQQLGIPILDESTFLGLVDLNGD